MSKSYIEKYVEDPIHMRLFQQERAIYEVTELLEAAMAQLGVNRTDLAGRLGKTKGWVTQLLDGEGNKTIRTVADAFAVLGQEYRSFFQPIQIGNRSTWLTSTVSRGASTRTVGDVPVLQLHVPSPQQSPTPPVNVEFKEAQ